MNVRRVFRPLPRAHSRPGIRIPRSLPRRVLPCAAAVALSLAAPSAVRAQTDPNNVPRPPMEELARFDPFLGRWAMRGPFASMEFVGVTEVRPAVKGWYVEWTNDLTGAGIQRELRMMMGYDRREGRYRVWRFETSDRSPEMMDSGQMHFEGDTLVQRWNRRDPEGRPSIFENRMIPGADSLRMLTFRVDPEGNRRLVGDIAGPRLGTPRWSQSPAPRGTRPSATGEALSAPGLAEAGSTPPASAQADPCGC